jgi:hypothetical protein
MPYSINIPKKKILAVLNNALQYLTNVFEYFINIKFNSKHTTCFHSILTTHLCKELTIFHVQINLLPKNVKHKLLITLIVIFINLFAPYYPTFYEWPVVKDRNAYLARIVTSILRGIYLKSWNCL